MNKFVIVFLAVLSTAVVAQDTQSIASEAMTAIRDQLKDPAAAQFKSVTVRTRPNGTHVVCGMVNAKNGYGAYSGFREFIRFSPKPGQKDALAQIRSKDNGFMFEQGRYETVCGHKKS